MGVSGLNLMRVLPSSANPNILHPLVEGFDWYKLVSEITNFGEEGDEVHYLMTLENFVSASQVVGVNTWIDSVDTPNATIGQKAAPYYRLVGSYNTSDITSKKMQKLNLKISEEELMKALVLQGMTQRLALGVLFGFDPEKTQGIMSNAFKTEALPADSAGNTTLKGYVAGELAVYLLDQFRDMLNYSFGFMKPVVVAGSRRAINYIRTHIVPLTAYQNRGAGTASVAEVLQNVIAPIANLPIEYVPTSYLENGVDGKDKLVLVSTGLTTSEMMKTTDMNIINTIGGGYVPNIYMDKIYELKQFRNPARNGIQNVMIDSIITPPIVTRKEAIKVIEFTY